MKKTYQISRVNNKRSYRRIMGSIRHIKGIYNIKLNKEKEILYVEHDDNLENVETLILKCLSDYEKSARI